MRRRSNFSNAYAKALCASLIGDRDGLFPTETDLDPSNERESVAAIKETGPYSSQDELYRTHLDLLTEDFILALRNQFDDIRRNPGILNSAACFTVTCHSVLVKRMGRQRHEIGMSMSFSTQKYSHIRWEEEKRLMVGNMVFLSRGNLDDYIVGIVHDSSPHLLNRGRMVIKLVSGVNEDGFFRLLPHYTYKGMVFRMVESAAFFFPYLHVTNRLRKDMKKGTMSPLRQFEKEIVRGEVPSYPPTYTTSFSMKLNASKVETLLSRFRLQLNGSQLLALESVLAHRVALVQGPPGTGKTYLGCKIAEYFVELKNLLPNLFTGPILIVTTTNHAVHEFLTRCTEFTDKIIHGYSEKHEQSDYGELQKNYDSTRDFDQRVELMKEADILSMTTTRAAYMRKQLDNLNIKIVIVEEAGEAMEGYILSTLPSGAEHLIQIGDHKQLRPSCAHLPLARSHHLDLSLFERLIKNGAECPMLNEQRRMRPAISKLVRCIYPTLTDHFCTKTRPSVIGVDLKVPVFFVSRPEPEKPEGKGYVNEWEADMAAELGLYLLTQGYPSENITILTTYRRQLSLILKNLRNLGKSSKKIRVSTIDNFQGEENNIIILSLVRSNTSSSIGFLKMENRACVALSRARDAFFILGNLPCLVSSGTPVWTHVRDELTRAGRVGPVLPLRCPHGKKFLTEDAEDVKEATIGCAVCQVGAALLATQRAVENAQAAVAAVITNIASIRTQLADTSKPPSAEDRVFLLEKKLQLIQKLVQRRDELSAVVKERDDMKRVNDEMDKLLLAKMIDVTTDSVKSVIAKCCSSLNRQKGPVESLFSALTLDD